MLPVINAIRAAHHLPDVTVLADAEIISEANQVALQAAGLSFVFGRPHPLLAAVWCANGTRSTPMGRFPHGLCLPSGGPPPRR